MFFLNKVFNESARRSSIITDKKEWYANNTSNVFLFLKLKYLRAEKYVEYKDVI